MAYQAASDALKDTSKAVNHQNHGKEQVKSMRVTCEKHAGIVCEGGIVSRAVSIENSLSPD
jgi:hypothetical protein